MEALRVGECGDIFLGEVYSSKREARLGLERVGMSRGCSKREARCSGEDRCILSDFISKPSRQSSANRSIFVLPATGWPETLTRSTSHADNSVSWSGYWMRLGALTLAPGQGRLGVLSSEALGLQRRPRVCSRPHH